VDFPSLFTDRLDALTDALDGSGDDLHAILSVLTDDLKAAVPSFVGLSVTVHVDGDAITVVAMNSRTAAASMLLPLAPLTGLPDRSHMVFYAANPGAFIDLAADTRAAYGLDGDVVLDGHLPPPDITGLSGADELAERSDINQAIGVLIEDGHPPTLARRELDTRAAAAGVTVHRIAKDILHQLGVTRSGGLAEI
jgi:hypothetical protein